MQNMAENKLKNLEKELTELKIKSPINQKEIIEQLKKNGDKCKELGKYDEALSYYKECLDIEVRSDNSCISSLLNNIASIYDNQEKYKEALKYYKKLYDKTLPSSHLSIADKIKDIGKKI